MVPGVLQTTSPARATGAELFEKANIIASCKFIYIFLKIISEETDLYA
jgi:hypothetical protein